MAADRERVLDWIRQLTHFRPRFAGTPSERAAAQALAGWCRELGFAEVEIRTVPGAPRPGFVIALHTGLAYLALCWGGFLGSVFTLVAAYSFYSEIRRRERILSRWLPAPASVDVVARAGAATPTQRIVLSAHIDAAQAGIIFSKRVADLFAGFADSKAGQRAPVGPLVLPELAIVLALVATLAQWFGAHGFLFGTFHLLLSWILLATALLTFQWAVSGPTPGANDNASAVAAMLAASERLLAHLPPDVELWAVGTGAEEVGCCGMTDFVARQEGWAKDATWFVNFECVGGGQLHYITSEGLALKTTYPTALLELTRRLTATGRFGEVTPTALMAGTDGHVPARAGYPTLSLISLEANGVPRNYHRLEDIVEDIDPEIVLRAADLGVEVALAAVRGETGPLKNQTATWHDPF